jgi:hypothetical protein
LDCKEEAEHDRDKEKHQYENLYEDAHRPKAKGRIMIAAQTVATYSTTVLNFLPTTRLFSFFLLLSNCSRPTEEASSPEGIIKEKQGQENDQTEIHNPNGIPKAADVAEEDWAVVPKSGKNGIEIGCKFLNLFA